MATDRISLTGLRIQANHGVFDFERENGQLFVVDVVAWLDLSPAALADDLTQTVHYGELADEIYAAVASASSRAVSGGHRAQATGTGRDRV
jgi:dihydroneopterin aldolase